MITRVRISGKEWLKVIRAPRLKVLRAHLFGLTLGLTALLTHLVFAARAEVTLLLLLAWFLSGYFFGAIMVLAYNSLAYLYLKIIHPEWLPLWFYYDPAQAVNIIKTPVPDQDWPASTHDLYDAAEANVFFHQHYDHMKDPYTIVFVANPLIEAHDSTPALPKVFRDPIMNDAHLFLKAIERALFSFEFNHEVVGRPGILSKIRIVTINPSERFRNFSATPIVSGSDVNFALVREFSSFAAAGDPTRTSTFQHRLLTVPERVEHVSSFVRQALVAQSLEHIEHIDVIFAISGSATHDLSSAEAATPGNWGADAAGDGKAFTFSIDPYCQKNDEILKNECECHLCRGGTLPINCRHSTPLVRGGGGPDLLMVHEYFPHRDEMGMVAISALDVRSKTPIHEFAHAMSNKKNGRIVDEYYDYDLSSDTAPVPPPGTPVSNPCPNEAQRAGDPVYPHVGIFVNRIFRNPEKMRDALARDTHKVEVHNIFARYNGYIYESDRQHLSELQNWVSYFPERRQREMLCTMDRAEDVFEFDELIRDFMYDCLWAKVNRGFPP